ncbi:MAG: long-chain fatty acid--CoA ligase [Verrucomicrobia bacterium]|nr:long-chain fatty acid--CoA ligase [Verrucomicrobiota bacterium]MBU4285654.1 long-chain fatty acid--CoA ligase [Verrucomicrobiota bacterium]
MKVTDCSLPDMFRAGGERFARQQAIVFDGRTLDFAAVDRISDRVAAALARRGIRKGDRIGLYCINSDWFPLAYFGILKAGAVVVPINLLLNPKEVAFILNDAGARALFYHGVFAPAVNALRPLAPDLAFCVCIGAPPAPPVRPLPSVRPLPPDIPWAEFAEAEGPAPVVAFNPAEDLAAILYTSGTTGRPKGAMLTHRNLVSNIRSTLQAMHVQPGEERFLVILPLFHAFAAMACMFLPLMSGSTMVPMSRFDPLHVAKMIAAERITLFMGVPSMYVALLRLPDDIIPHFETLKFCVSGGAALPVAVMREFETRFGKKIYEGDGPTECSPVTCVNPIGGQTKSGTVGRPVPDVEMKIVDEQGRDVADGTIGEICVRGPNVMKGYWKLPAETKEAFFGDWFRTGDLGTRDADGYFSIVDRRKDMIIVNGMNIYPRIIEEVLARCEGIREAAVVGEPHKMHGEIPVAYVALKENAAVTIAQLRACCLASLGRHEVPRKFIFLPELPKNAAGKIMKRELRKHGELERGVLSRTPDA